MRKSLLIKIKLLGGIAALMLCTTVSAVGLGGINVASALGQQLKADIELVAVSKAEKSSLVARLASPEAYKSAGLDFPFGNKFKFQIETRTDGEPYLTVTSAQPLNDPFVIMLVELTWSSGKLLREYTFLLDPPGYVPQQPAQAAVQTVAPAVPVEPTPTEVASEVPAVPTEMASVSEVPVVEPNTIAASEVPPVAPGSVATEPAPDGVATGSITIPAAKEWLVVQRGDTLRQIAAQYKLADISLERMLVALYRVNADEFDGKNMNRIKAGKILQLPHEADVSSVNQTDAKKEIRAQVADWNVYRQKLASAAAIRESRAAQQVSTGKISSSVADQTPVARESAKEVLKLSRGEAPGDQAAAGIGGKTSAQDKTNAAQEDTIAKDRAEKEEQMRTAMLEKNIQDMQRLEQLKAEAAALAQAPIETASKVVVVSPLAATSAVAAASAVAPVAKPKPAEVEPEPSLLDQFTALLEPILSHPLYLAGGAAVLLALGGLVFLLKRRKKKAGEIGENISGDASEDMGSASGRMTAPVVPSPDTGDFTRTMVAKPEAVSQVDNVDPISEADLFLNFGRDAQAEEILKEALKNTPTNHLIHLKLLGIYANRKDVNLFSNIAQELQKLGNEHAWEEAAALGRELDPSNPLYGGAGSMNAPAASQPTATFSVPESSPAEKPADKPGSSGLDFDFDLGALSGKATPSPEQDFLADAGKTMKITAGEMAAMQQTSKMDFDITAAQSSPPAADKPAAAPDLNELIFSVTGSHAAMSAAQPASQPAKADDGVMEFTIDFPVKANPAPPSGAAEADLAGINLNLADPAASGGSTPEVRDDHWQEVATKLDLAKAYQEMGDADGVREILAEVLNEGDAGQQETARTMLRQLG